MKLDLKINDFARENTEDIGMEEPVSPPACEADEGPPLIFSQSIEDIAREVVDENRMFKKKARTNVSDFDNIPKVVELVERNPFTPLIPATVCDISEETLLLPRTSQQPPTLHMSGGMVSTDMTPNTSSVPTSITTNNTNTSITMKEDESLDNIFQYFKCKPQTDKDDDQRNLPLDLSLGKVSEGSKLLPKTVETRGIQLKRKRDENSSKEAANVLKKQVIIQTDVQGSNFRMEESNLEQERKLKKLKEGNIGKQDYELSEIGANIRTETKNENLYLDELGKGNDFECKLLLPKRRGQNAKIVFPNGSHVEIKRSLFAGLEHQISEKKHRSKEKFPLKDKENSKRKGKAQTRDAKDQDSRSKQVGIQLDLTDSPYSNLNKGLCDIKPKDMPMIVLDEDQTVMKGTNEVCESSMTPPPTPPPFSNINACNLKSRDFSTENYSTNSVSPPQTPPPRQPLSTPPPSNPSSPTGLHKLPSIVSKPCYYTKCESRKIMKLK